MALVRGRSHRMRSTLQQCVCKLWNTLQSMGVFTQLASNIKGFACKFARKCAFASCVNWASGLETQLRLLLPRWTHRSPRFSSALDRRLFMKPFQNLNQNLKVSGQGLCLLGKRRQVTNTSTTKILDLALRGDNTVVQELCMKFPGLETLFLWICAW